MSETRKRALVAGHGGIAAGLVSAVEQITGLGGVLMPLQTLGLCADDIKALLHDTLAETGARVIFTDLHAGSCTMSARRVQREHPDVVLVAGVNLPMLLDFVLSSNPNDVEAATAAAERGRAAVSVHGGTA